MSKSRLTGVVVVGILILGATRADAGAVIFNTGVQATSRVALGVNDLGHTTIVDPFGSITPTNTSNGVGLSYFFGDAVGWQDSTSPATRSEGWGVSGTFAGIGAVAGYVNTDIDGVVNLSVGSFASDAAAGTGTFATSMAFLTSLSGLTVTQDYRASTGAPGVLFVDTVTITNGTGADITDLRYTRSMDWDIPPTEFSEYVSIVGTATTTFLEESHDNGFSTNNPLGSPSPLNPATLNVDFVDDGPADHGAYFRFNFGDLADGESFTFNVYYGAAASERSALAAISAEGIELFSLGQQRGDPTFGTPATFIFGFSGVGGTPYNVPEPGSMILLGSGVLGLAGFAWKRRKQQRC